MEPRNQAETLMKGYSFPSPKQSTLEVTRATKTELETRVKTETELTKKDSEKEREIAKLTMISLEASIKRQSKQIVNLERQPCRAGALRGL